MLQLYIDGQRVNLSENVRTDFYRRNPFFTNDGDYTLDIDIDLADPANALVYHHAYRIDRIRRASRRTAVLIDETTVLIKGTEIVLDMHEGYAKIQIVAGASALNYEMGDRRIRELDLYHSFNDGESKIFPVCALNNSDHADYGMMDSERTKTENGITEIMWTIVNGPRNRHTTSGEIVLASEVRQPYMWAVVEHVIAALGFTISENVIKTDQRYSKMVMVHAIRTTYIADMLPDWTVKQFFEEVQKFFNVIFLTDYATNEVSIVHAYDYFSVGTVEIPHSKIISLKKDFDQKSDLTMVDYSAVHYALPDKMVCKYEAIPAELMKLATMVPAQQVSGGRPYDVNYYAGIWKAIMGNESFLSETDIPQEVRNAFAQRKVYTMTINQEQRQFVLWAAEKGENTEDGHLGGYCALKMVNAFAAKESNRSDVTDVELKIVPVRMASSPIQGADGVWWQYPLPAVDGQLSTYYGGKFGGAALIEEAENEENGGFNDEIKAGEAKYDNSKQETNRADVIFLAFYMEAVTISGWEDPDNNVPSDRKIRLASPDWQVQLHRRRGAPGSSHFWKSSRQVKLSNTPLTMAINGTNGMDAYTYSRNPSVDTSVAYTIDFRCHTMPDIRKIFLIENRKFCCKQLKYDISAGRRSEKVEGIFFPILDGQSSEGGESLYYVSYSLTRVVIAHRIETVLRGESLDIELKPHSGGGSASWVMSAQVEMGGVDITQQAFTPSGRTGSIHIAAVTGDVSIVAEYG